MNPHVVWHDVECGGYDADLPLWQRLAREAPDGVLDVGAGTGRVALALARAGHEVVALDVDADLLAELERRAHAAGVRVETLVADAQSFALARRVGLIAVPMQTIQLLADRPAFFAAARRALLPGGRVAIAIATGLEAFEGAEALPFPDLGQVDGWRFVSQPVAIRLEPDGARIERVRRLISPAGESATTEDVIHLAAVTPERLAAEAAAHALTAEDVLQIPETAEHVGSEVVVLRG
jgi:SAM-dependent methyltransferase